MRAWPSSSSSLFYTYDSTLSWLRAGSRVVHTTMSQLPMYNVYIYMSCMYIYARVFYKCTRPSRRRRDARLASHTALVYTRIRYIYILYIMLKRNPFFAINLLLSSRAWRRYTRTHDSGRLRPVRYTYFVVILFIYI